MLRRGAFASAIVAAALFASSARAQQPVAPAPGGPASPPNVAGPSAAPSAASPNVAPTSPPPNAASAQAPMPSLAQVQPPARTGRRLSLDECIALALRNNAEVLTAKYKVDEAEAQRSGARGQFGPKLQADANAFQWDRPFKIDFGGQNFPVRDAFTWSFTASLIQPITGLIPIYAQYKLRDLGVDVAQVQREVAQRDTAYRVVEAYFRLLQAERLSEVAATSVAELEAQLRQAQSLHANGVTGQNDVLRAQLALAGARQNLIQARGTETVARANLASTMGVPPGEAVDAQPLASEPQVTPVSPIEDLERAAVVQRAEVRELQHRIAQAKHAVDGAWARLAPQINAVASYQHNEGSQFTQTNAGYVGATASWDVWDWGTNTSRIAEAKAQLRQAEVARGKLEEDIRVQLRQAYVRLQAAAEALQVAKASVANAEENYRLATKRYAAAMATSFDVVDAEALVTQARGQLQTSMFDYLVARAALERAAGENRPRL